MTTPKMIPVPGDPAHDRKSYDHESMAAVLRQNPGVWHSMGDLTKSYARLIRIGSLRHYRPAGAYKAKVHEGVVYAMYDGIPLADVPVTREKRDRAVSIHNHPGVRQKLQDHAEGLPVEGVSEGGWLLCPLFPQPYATRIRYGQLGYEPEGAYETKWISDFGVYVRLTPGGPATGVVGGA